MASRSAAACWAARVRATRARRVAAVDPVDRCEDAAVAFLTAGFFAVETVFFVVEAVVCALDCAGPPTTAIAARKQKSLEIVTNRIRITAKPLCRKLLRNVSAL
jgi:hypothetical protein